ncbi:HIT family protein [Paenisporosarcina indica]|uniref:HIT family protein n=1 Tax=Paenisporosarcina indica TaxID=650093 RepID=UPI00094F6EC2|nr:HIT domain-containing protein [Paenisporosarcina indica]
MNKLVECSFCDPEKDKAQVIVFENKFCRYLQHPEHQTILEGSGLIVPKIHRQTVFDLTQEEWNATYELMQQVKEYADDKYSPDGYTLGWNVGEASNQSIPHAHFHILPRFADEPFAGKGIRAWFKSEENRRPSR